MRKTFLLTAGLALAASAAMATTWPIVPRAAAPAIVDRPEVRRMRMPDGAPYSRYKRRKPGPGWTTRQVQRMAVKRRNQARNRAAHRGRR